MSKFFAQIIGIWLLMMWRFKNVNGWKEKEDPPQQACLNLKAVKWEDLEYANQIFKRSRVMLWKVTEMSNYLDNFANNENYCSHLRVHFSLNKGLVQQVIRYKNSMRNYSDFSQDFGPDCVALRYQKKGGLLIKLRIRRPMLVTASYNKRTDDILRTYSKITTLDRNYAVTLAELVKMEHINRKGKVTTLNSIPASVKEDYGVEIAAIAVGLNQRWIIYQTCDKKITWVDILIPTEEGINLEEFFHEFKEEVDTELKRLNIDTSTMKDVSLDLPFLPASPGRGYY